METKRIAIDTSKHVFMLHGFDAEERTVLRCNLKRDQMQTCFGKQPPTDVAGLLNNLSPRPHMTAG